MKLPKPPPKTSPPESLEFSGFGVRFSATGIKPILLGSALAALALLAVCLVPGAFTNVAGMARDVAVNHREAAQPLPQPEAPREAQTQAMSREELRSVRG